MDRHADVAVGRDEAPDQRVERVRSVGPLSHHRLSSRSIRSIRADIRSASRRCCVGFEPGAHPREDPRGRADAGDRATQLVECLRVGPQRLARLSRPARTRNPDLLLAVAQARWRSSSAQRLARIRNPAKRKALAATCHTAESPHVSIRATRPYVTAMGGLRGHSLRAHRGAGRRGAQGWRPRHPPSTAAESIPTGKDGSEIWSLDLEVEGREADPRGTEGDAGRLRRAVSE